MSQFETRLASRSIVHFADIISMFLRLFAAILLSVFTFAAAAKPKARSSAEFDPGKRIIVTVKKTAKLSQWLSVLPRGAQIVSQAHPLYVVELLTPVTPSLLKKIRANPAVRHVEQDSKVKFARTREFANQCVRAAQSSNIQDILNLVDESGEDCELAYSCSADGKPALQAQLAVGGDLMSEELKRIGLSEGHTKVAVVDSGFNPNLTQYMSKPPKWYGDPHGHSVEMNEGVYQHGSPVAGLIGAKNGVGLAPGAELGMFQVAMNKEGIASKAEVQNEIQRACASGHKIINVSVEWIYPDRDNPAWVNDLAEQGCMVVNSAGNEPGSGIEGTSKEDAWLRVGGKDTESGENGRLELGEVNAPGFGISTLNGGSESGCFDEPLARTAGTSFSAPIVSAILANVRGVLAKDSKFNALKGPEQIKLLNAMIGQSTRGGMVNGLRAVLLAEAWTQDTAKPLDPSGVGGLLASHVPPVCSTPPKSTDLDSLGCRDRRASMNAVRARAAVCSPVNPKEVSEMILSLASLEEPSIAQNLSLYLDEAAGKTLRTRIGLMKQEKGISVTEREERAAARAEAIREVGELIQLNESLQPESVGQDPLQEWNQQISAQESSLKAGKAETASRLAELQKAPGSHTAQIRSLTARAESLDRSIACFGGWRSAFKGAGASTSAAQLYDLVARTKQSTGCEEPVEYFPGPYLGLARDAANGGTFDAYWSAHQAELSSLKDRFNEINESL